MRFPEYNHALYPQPAINIRDAYVKKIAALDVWPQPADDDPASLRFNSLAIGRACVISRLSNEAAFPMAIEVLDRIKPLVEADAERGRFGSLASTARLFIANGQRSIQNARAGIHAEAIKHIKDNLYPNNSLDETDRIGELAHARAMAVLSRTRHPYYAPVYSLAHHDKHKGNKHNERMAPRNFDIALIESLPSNALGTQRSADEVVQLHMLQVKAGCFALCNRFEPSAEPQKNQVNIERRRLILSRLATERTKYDRSITLISGCCDFQVTETPDSSQLLNHGQLDRLLIAEHDDVISDTDRQVLDIVTNHALLVATSQNIGDRDGRYDRVSMKYAGMRIRSKRPRVSLAPETRSTKAPLGVNPVTVAARIMARRTLPPKPEA